MGEYFMVANLDKKEFIHPHILGCGLKLMEQVGVEFGTGSALLLLLSSSCSAWYGSESPLVGRWHGDRIVVAGDNSDDTYLLCCTDPEDKADLMDENGRYQIKEEEFFKDISLEVAKLIEEALEGEFYGTGWRDFRYLSKA